MDLTVWFPGSTWWAGVDVTVRYSGAKRYTKACTSAGSAAARAEAEKHQKYGDDVIPLAFEQEGRLGEEGQNALEELAGRAASDGISSTPARSLLLRWRRRMEAAMVFAIADAHLLALGGNAGLEDGSSKGLSGG